MNDILPPPPRRLSLLPLVLLLLFLGEAAIAAGAFYEWKTAPAETLALNAMQAQLTLVEKATDTQTEGALNSQLALLTAELNTLQTQVGTDHASIASLQAQNASYAALEAKLSRLAAVDHAWLALQAGQPLGDIPNAPPALARYATTAPPTQASLAQSFPAAARAGEAASIAGLHQATIWSRIMARLENIITITKGDHVIIGAPAAAAITQARDDLNAGDLAGAVAKLNTLSDTTQTAMASWLQPARALLAAREALLTMAAQ